MPYATQTDAENMYGTDFVITSTDRDRDGSVDATVMAAALERADSDINGALAGRVSLPLTEVPANLKYIAIDLALYYAAVTCDVATTRHETMFEQANAKLDRMSKNVEKLGVEDPPNNAAQATTIVASPRLFTRSTMGEL